MLKMPLETPLIRNLTGVSKRFWRSFLDLISSRTASFTNAIGVNGRAATAHSRPNQSAFLAPSNSADDSTGARAAGSRQLISMLLPEAASMFVTIPNTTAMSMGNVAVTMSVAATLS
jgi:hypothetical protein